jgi:GNAT superfamily N-acetyltransferase
VVRLGRLMFESMGTDSSDPGWQAAGERHVRERLGVDLAVYVADGPHGRLVASAAGTVSQRLPTPNNPSALVGYIQWVCTEADWRGKGLGRAVMEALLAWYDGEEVAVVELHATPVGEPLYRSLGFNEGDGSLALRRRARA